MTTRPRVLGLVMARDEWPLLSVSVAHALAGHCDHVLVLDHASQDGTPAGLETLGRRFPGRLSVLRLDDGAFVQEAATTLLLEAADAASYDWVHVFDADEFVLTPPGSTLADVLADVDPGVDVVRYDVQNWASPSGFDEADLSSYDGLRRRVVPDPALARMPATRLAAGIEAGRHSFLAVPYPSKVIFRGGRVHWLTAGAHLVRVPVEATEVTLDPGILRAAHVPYLTEPRLLLKVAHGRALAEAGLPPEHGWHNQLLHRMALAGTLPEFWRRHSVGDGSAEVGTGLVLVDDDALAVALAPTLATLRTGDPGGDDAVAASTVVPVSCAVRSIRNTQTAYDELLANLGRVIGDQQRLIGVVAALTAERDELAARLEAVPAPRRGGLRSRIAYPRRP